MLNDEIIISRGIGMEWLKSAIYHGAAVLRITGVVAVEGRGTKVHVGYPPVPDGAILPPPTALKAQVGRNIVSPFQLRSLIDCEATTSGEQAPATKRLPTTTTDGAERHAHCI